MIFKGEYCVKNKSAEGYGLTVSSYKTQFTSLVGKYQIRTREELMAGFWSRCLVLTISEVKYPHSTVENKHNIYVRDSS